MEMTEKQQAALDRRHSYQGMTVAQGVDYVMKQLTAGDIRYASDPARGECRGFAALGDRYDHNLLLPHVKRFDSRNKKLMAFLTAVIEGVDQKIKCYHR